MKTCPSCGAEVDFCETVCPACQGPVPLTEEELEAMAMITPEDIEYAKSLIEEASPDLADLLNAKPVEKKKRS